MADSLEHELTAHASALRSMARLLVGEQEADDLVQDTALQALGRPPSQPTGLRGWLLAVLRHRASKQRRTARRRQQREGAVAPSEPVLTPFGIAVHKETLVQLHATLMALPEPYLSTLLLRFFVDLTPTQIAAHTGVPLATVKSRLQRGLALLRERLEAAQPRDWRAALGAAFGLEPALPLAAGLAVTSTGVLLMGSGIKLALAGVTAAALAGWLWLGSEAPPPGPATPTMQADGSSLAIAGIERPSAVDPGEPTRADASVRTAVPTARVTIHGRCVDERGAGLGNLAIELRGKRVQGGMGKDFEREYGEWLLRRGRFDWQDLVAATAADGRFEFAVTPSPMNLSLWVRRDGLEHALGLHQQLRPEDVDLGDLLVPIACALRVNVVDSNGAPMLSPRVSITETERPQQERVFEARISAPVLASDGSSTLAVVAGGYSCGVYGRPIAHGEPCTVLRGVSRHEHTIVVAALPTTDTLTGIVVDENELPLAGVDVSAYNGTGSASAGTNAEGRFTVYRPATGGSTVSLQFGKDGYVTLLGPRLFQFGEPDLRFTMHAAASLEVHVVEAGSNRPVEDFQVRLWPAPGNTASIFRDEGQYRCSGHHPDGITQVTDLPYGDQLLLVEPHRWDLWRSALVPVQIAPRGRARIEVRLGPSAERLLCVRRSDGAPVDDAEVEVVEQAEHALTLATPIKDFEQWWSPGDAPEVRVLVQRGSTDERGQLQLHGPVDREVALRITANGFATQIVEHVPLTDKSPLVVTLAVGARLIAHIGPPAFVAELRKACRLPLTGPAPKATHNNQPGFRLCRGTWPRLLEVWPPTEQKALLVAGDGTVVLEGAPPGDWQLGLESWDEFPKQTLVWHTPLPIANVTLRAGATTEATADLSSWLPGELTGSLTCNGTPVANAEIGVEIARPRPGYPRARTFTRVATDADGRFRIRAREGTVRLAVDRRDLDGFANMTQWVRSSTTAFLPAGGHVAQDFAVDACPLQLRVLDAAGTPVEGVSLFLQHDDPTLRHTTTPSDREGRITCEVEATSFAVQVLTRRLQDPAAQQDLFRTAKGDPDPLAAHRLPLGNVTGKPGTTVSFDVRLPPAW